MPITVLLVLRDTEPGGPEVSLSPLRYHHRQQAEIEAEVTRPVDLATKGAASFMA